MQLVGIIGTFFTFIATFHISRPLYLLDMVINRAQDGWIPALKYTYENKTVDYISNGEAHIIGPTVHRSMPLFNKVYEGLI